MSQPRLHRLRTAPEAVAAVAVFLATVVQAPVAFKWDALGYWNGSSTLAHLANPYTTGWLAVRGVWTPVLYLPAAIAARIAGASGVWVLLENSVLIALVAAVLVPRVAALWRPTAPATVYLCAGLTWLFLGRYAPYPLTDVWGAALILLSAVLLVDRQPRWAVMAGVAAGLAFNIRPAYLLPILFGVGAVVWFRRMSALWFALGVGLSLLPESLYNLYMGHGWHPTAPQIASQTQKQSVFGSFTVRHDTAAYLPRSTPRQFYCDPSMARLVGKHAPHSTLGLVNTYAHHPFQALALVSEKISASVHWPISEPYLSPSPTSDHVFALLVTAVTVVGAVELFRHLGRASLPQWFVFGTWLGAIWTIAMGAPEVRYALPLVMIGVPGTVIAIMTQRSWRFWAVNGVVVAVVFSVGWIGLIHPGPPGLVTTAVCAHL